MHVIGIDLAGPSNMKDTVLTHFIETSTGLQFMEALTYEEQGEFALRDHGILDYIKNTIHTLQDTSPSTTHFAPLIVAIDAPLSYQDGGGDRPADRALRQFIQMNGMESRSIMAPTFQRMVYLTLRGVVLSREITQLSHQLNFPIQICEVHPGAALILRQPIEERKQLRTYKKEMEAFHALKKSLPSIGLENIPPEWIISSHRFDACGAALAGWHWGNQRSMWHVPADAESMHPYAFVI